MTDINIQALDRELKRGTSELLILSLLGARPRHGYELSKLIHMRSGGQIQLHIDSLYPCCIASRNVGGSRGRGLKSPTRDAADSTKSRLTAGALRIVSLDESCKFNVTLNGKVVLKTDAKPNQTSGREHRSSNRTFYKANGVRPFDEVVLLQMNMLETPAMADRYYLLV